MNKKPTKIKKNLVIKDHLFLQKENNELGRLEPIKVITPTQKDKTVVIADVRVEKLNAKSLI
jgi:hypothetical protein